jgi:hypothetical protein
MPVSAASIWDYPKLIVIMPIPQLRRIWARDGNLSNHVLVSIVRLIVETNLATSKDFRISMI